jgi:hypothetical protein
VYRSLLYVAPGTMLVRAIGCGWAKKATGIDGLVRVVSIAQSTKEKTGYNHDHNPHEPNTARWLVLSRFQSSRKYCIVLY